MKEKKKKTREREREREMEVCGSAAAITTTRSEQTRTNNANNNTRNTNTGNANAVDGGSRGQTSSPGTHAEVKCSPHARPGGTYAKKKRKEWVGWGAKEEIGGGKGRKPGASPPQQIQSRTAPLSLLLSCPSSLSLSVYVSVRECT